ncbi:MAG: transcriptional repressor LexA [Alphaproteobacteria bacterium]|nr:transcriptional repressor LexA [Alphaproteobacteria bacterium]
MLTKKQLELLLFIDSHMKTNHTAPSFEEMKEAVKLRSKSGIHRLVTALEERGFIRRLPHRARALEVVKVPQQRVVGGEDRPHLVPSSNGLRGNVISGDFGQQQERTGGASTSRPRVVSVPLYGRIAAGVPIEALRDESTRLDLPASLLGSGEHYALEVEGDSMIDAGIFDGDTALIQRCETAENGAIVVALVDDSEVTLKRLRRKGESIALEPANPAYETRIFGPSRVRVQGRLVGLMRRY